MTPFGVGSPLMSTLAELAVCLAEVPEPRGAGERLWGEHGGGRERPGCGHELTARLHVGTLLFGAGGWGGTLQRGTTVNVSALDRIDRHLGQAAERTVAAHHRRRLARLEHSGSYNPPADGTLWCSGDPPPRDGCSLEVLIDGAEYLPRVAEAIQGAKSFVHIAGWHMTPGFGLTRDGSARPLRDLLGSVAERADVRVLLWAGAPVPLFKPRARRGARPRATSSCSGTRIRCALDARERPMHCHHEKLVIVDGEVAFVGGIDLTSLGGDRFDSAPHQVRGGLGWHDVSTCLRGPAVADVAAHLAARWKEVAGERRRRPCRRRRRPARRRCRSSARCPRRSTTSCRAATSGSSRRTCARCARARAVHLPGEPVPVVAGDRRASWPTSSATRPRTTSGCVVVLPARPNNGADDTRGQLARPGRRRRRQRAVPRRDAARAHRRRDRVDVRAREGGDRRRPLAHDRLGEPQRALAVQRLRDERRDLRRRAGARHAAAAVGRAPRTRTPPASRAR